MPDCPFVVCHCSRCSVLHSKGKGVGTPLKGISLPNGEDLLNAQFADDTSLFLGLSEENFENAYKRINFFCMASRSKISPSKFDVLDWSIDPLDWLVSRGWH